MDHGPLVQREPCRGNLAGGSLSRLAESSSQCPWLLRGCAVCDAGAAGGGGAGVLRANSNRHRSRSIPAAVGYHLLTPSLDRRAAHSPAKREALLSDPQFAGV